MVLLLVGATTVVVIVADASAMSKGEVERIWLPFVPWLTLSFALLPGTVAALGARAPGRDGDRRAAALLHRLVAGHATRSRSGAVAKAGRPDSGGTSAVKPSSAAARAGEATTWRTSPGRKPPVTSGSIRCSLPSRDVLERRRGSRPVGPRRRCRRRTARQARRPPHAGPPGWPGRRRRRARSRASGRRPRRPEVPPRARARSGTSRPPRSTACLWASRGRRRCGSAAPRRPRRPGAPRPTRSAPARPCSRRTTSAGRAVPSRRRAPSPADGRRPGSGSRSHRPPASGPSAAAVTGRRARSHV